MTILLLIDLDIVPLKTDFDLKLQELNNPEVHEESFFIHDIALIKIDEPFLSSYEGRNVCPICLMPNNMPTLNQDITIVGMGKTKKNGKKPLTLQFATVKQITGKQCFKKWYPNQEIPKTLSNEEKKGFCIRGNNKELVCHGDSGSPAVWKNKNGVEFLIGIACHTQKKCGRKWMQSNNVMPKKSVKPSRYAKIPGSIFKWIEQNGGKEIKTMIKQCNQTPDL